MRNLDVGYALPICDVHSKTFLMLLMHREMHTPNSINATFVFPNSSENIFFARLNGESEHSLNFLAVVASSVAI